MVMSCVAYGCLNKMKRTDVQVSYFRFPMNDQDRLHKWCVAMKRVNGNWNPTANHRICSQHFITGKPHGDPNHPDYIPTIFKYQQKSNPEKNAKALARFNRRQKRISIQHQLGIGDSEKIKEYVQHVQGLIAKKIQQQDAAEKDDIAGTFQTTKQQSRSQATKTPAQFVSVQTPAPEKINLLQLCLMCATHRGQQSFSLLDPKHQLLRVILEQHFGLKVNDCGLLPSAICSLCFKNLQLWRHVADTIRTSRQFFCKHVKSTYYSKPEAHVKSTCTKPEAISQPATSRTSAVILEDCSATQAVRLNQTQSIVYVMKPPTISVNHNDPLESDFISLPKNQGVNQVPLSNFPDLGSTELTHSNLDLGASSSSYISNCQNDINLNTETEIDIKSEPIEYNEVSQEFNLDEIRQKTSSSTETADLEIGRMNDFGGINFEFADCKEELSEKQIQIQENSVMSVKMLDSNSVASLTNREIEANSFRNSKNEIKAEVEPVLVHTCF